jgi:hypothetical protein
LDTHVKVLGALQMALGILGLFSAAILLVVFGGVAGAVTGVGDPDTAIALPIIGITGMALITFLVLLSLPGVIIVIPRRTPSRQTFKNGPQFSATGGTDGREAQTVPGGGRPGESWTGTRHRPPSLFEGPASGSGSLLEGAATSG